MIRRLRKKNTYMEVVVFPYSQGKERKRIGYKLGVKYTLYMYAFPD